MDKEGIPLIEESEEITADWARRALAAGGLATASEITEVKVEKLSGVTNALGNLYRCRLIGQDGKAFDPASVIIKLPSDDPMAYWFAKWLSLHRREYVFYKDISSRGFVRVPTYYYGQFDPKSHRFVLALEDLGGMEAIRQVPGFDEAHARRAIHSIAMLQGRCWETSDKPDLSGFGEFLSTKQSRIMQAVTLLTLPAAFDRFGDLFTDKSRRLAESFGLRVSAHFTALATGPKTVVHGDFRTDNMMFGGENHETVAVIDWQGCGLGCGMYDIAFFLGFSVSSELRRSIEKDLLNEYHEIVTRLGAKNYTREDCWTSYRRNMLGILMPIVIGCGALDMSDPKLVKQTRVLLKRVLTSIEDLDSWEFLPQPPPFLAKGWGFSILSRFGFQVYRLVLKLLPRKRSAK